MALAKLTLEARVRGADKRVVALYNPTEITMDLGSQFAEIPVPGLQQPVLHFVRGETQSLSFELFLDATKRPEGATFPATGDLSEIVADLRSLVRVDGHHHAPPIVTVSWGARSPIGHQEGPWRGVITQLRERFVVFSEDGKPLRARVNVTLKRYRAPEEQRRAIDPQSPDRTKTRVVREGDRLDLIAHEEYGDSRRWRLIAEHNGLSRPRVLRVGTVLEIPAI